MTAIEELIAEGTPHGELWIGFTPDEEVGAGADLFDLSIFQADYAYTVDGDYEAKWLMKISMLQVPSFI